MSYWLIQGDPGFMKPEAFKFEGPFFLEKECKIASTKLQLKKF